MSHESQPAVEQQFKQAVDLAQRGRRAQALELFEGCLALAAEQARTLAIEQVATILQEIAWCYGDMGRWEEAWPVYDRIERLLKQEHGWQAAVPYGIQVSVPAGYAAAPRLAAHYESLGIAYDNAGDMQRAMDVYLQAIEGYTALGNLPKAATVWHHVALGCQRREDWPGLQRAAERMLELWSQVEGVYGQVWAWQYLAQAHSNQGRLKQALNYMEQVVAVERKLQHRDLARDEAILDDLRRAYARTPGGLLRRLLGRARRSQNE